MDYILKNGKIENGTDYLKLLKRKYADNVVKRTLEKEITIEFNTFFVVIPAPAELQDFEIDSKDGVIAIERLEAVKFSNPVLIKFYTYDLVQHDNLNDTLVYYAIKLLKYDTATEEQAAAIATVVEDGNYVAENNDVNMFCLVEHRAEEDVTRETRDIKEFYQFCIDYISEKEKANDEILNKIFKNM